MTGGVITADKVSTLFLILRNSQISLTQYFLTIGVCTHLAVVGHAINFIIYVQIECQQCNDILKVFVVDWNDVLWEIS